jgi:phosphoribosyl 1,2-cyclic phosphodiesterase
MQLQVLGSSSSGNGYLLFDDHECLILECGVPFSEVKKLLDFKIHKIVGCLCTHCHCDHSKYISEYINSGIKVYTSKGTKDNIKLKPKDNNYNIVSIKSKETISIGKFKIMPFDVVHDAPEPFGFYINHPNTGNILFITDTKEIPFYFANLKHLFIECNYCDDIINDKLCNFKINSNLSKRIVNAHLPLEKCLDFLQNSDLSKIESIVLLHLSYSNSDSIYFIKKVQELTGKATYVADKGFCLNL